MKRLLSIAFTVAVMGVIASAGGNTLKAKAFEYSVENVSYTIQPKDTVYSLMNGDVALFEQENPDLDSSKIQAGTTVNLPVRVAVAESGDTWYKLFGETGLTEDEVFSMNPNASIDRLVVGQKIYLAEVNSNGNAFTNTTAPKVVEKVITTKTTAEVIEESVTSSEATETSIQSTATTTSTTLTDSTSTSSAITKSFTAPKIINQTVGNTDMIDKAVNNAVANYCTKWNSAIGVGLYRLDGTPVYTYNPYQEISGGCTIKLPFATYALKKAERTGVSLWEDGMTYQSWHRNDGSGDVKYSAYGTWYNFSTLFQKMLRISDNTAYNMNSEFFGHGTEFQNYLSNIGGQNLYGCMYGIASVNQRKNEMLDTLEYINSGAKYSSSLKGWITNSPYCYIAQGMTGNHTWMHKSGWCDSSTYMCASDFAVIDNKYIVIVMTQNLVDSSGSHRGTAAIGSISRAIETYVSTYGI